MDQDGVSELKDFFSYVDVNNDGKIGTDDLESIFQSLGLEDDEIDLLTRDISLPLQFPLLLSMFNGRSLLNKGLKAKEVLRLLHNIDDPKKKLTWSSLRESLNLPESDWKFFQEKYSNNGYDQNGDNDIIDLENLSKSLEWKHF